MTGMNVLLSEHTFLVISFVLAGWALYKFAYKKLDSQIENTIDDIRNAIKNNERARQNTEDEVKRLQVEINKLTEKAKTEETAARQEARLRSESNNEKIAKIIAEKQKEYEKGKLSLENDFLSRATSWYVGIIMKKVKEELKNSVKDEDFQKRAIDSSFDLIEKYIARNK